MSKIWEPASIETYKQWLRDIQTEASDELSEWELDFLDSLATKLEMNRQLTERQAQILENIYVEKTK